MNLKINVLGTDYTVVDRALSEDSTLEGLAGYCDHDGHLIVIRTQDDECPSSNFDAYRREVLRHELIHAALYESGLGDSWEHNTLTGHDETVVDWFAIQFPKLVKIFMEAGCGEG